MDITTGASMYGGSLAGSSVYIYESFYVNVFTTSLPMTGNQAKKADEKSSEHYEDSL